MRPGRTLLAVLLVVTFAQPGCSFVFVKGPPASAGGRPDPFEAMADCTETRVPPVLDTVAAGLAGAYALAAVATLTGTPPPDATEEQIDHTDTVHAEFFWGGLIVGAVMTASAIWGFRATRKCREYVEERSRKDMLWLRPGAP